MNQPKVACRIRQGRRTYAIEKAPRPGQISITANNRDGAVSVDVALVSKSGSRVRREPLFDITVPAEALLAAFGSLLDRQLHDHEWLFDKIASNPRLSAELRGLMRETTTT